MPTQAIRIIYIYKPTILARIIIIMIKYLYTLVDTHAKRRVDMLSTEMIFTASRTLKLTYDD